MAKRIRQVHKSGMVAHLWANQSQAAARNATHNFYFEGATIYSYGSHFPIARHVERNGERCVLFTTASYSATTNGHKHGVSHALAGSDATHTFKGQTIFTVPAVLAYRKEQHRVNLDDYRLRALSLARRIVKARINKPFLIQSLDSLVREANAYSKFFGLRSVVKVPTDLDIKAEREIAKRHEAAEKRRRAKELAERVASAMERLPAWLSGDPEIRSYSLQALPDTYLRVRGDTIETSRGAEVPLRHATRLLPRIRSGKLYERNGHTEHVGHFAVDRIDQEGNMVVGCHTIKRPEIERIAAQLGL